MSVAPFHLAIPVWNLETCRIFYRDILGCEEGRHSDHWVDFNFFGHQLVIHFKPKEEETIFMSIRWMENRCLFLILE